MAGELRSLQATPGNLALLEALQWRLIDRIKMAERHLRRYRLILGQLKTRLRSRLSWDMSLNVKDSISRDNDGVDGLQYKVRVWRVFGDGIAHIYLDKYALKQTLYNSADFEPKEEPGFLDGKDGFAGEWAVVLDAIRAGVPTLLADLTNIIRHGDVCLMGELRADLEPADVTRAGSCASGGPVGRQSSGHGVAACECSSPSLQTERFSGQKGPHVQAWRFFPALA
jgi:hypothetical protein